MDETKKTQALHVARMHGRALALAEFLRELAKQNQSPRGELTRDDLAQLRRQLNAMGDDVQHMRSVLDRDEDARQLELGAFSIEPGKVQ